MIAYCMCKAFQDSLRAAVFLAHVQSGPWLIQRPGPTATPCTKVKASPHNETVRHTCVHVYKDIPPTWRYLCICVSLKLSIFKTVYLSINLSICSLSLPVCVSSYPIYLPINQNGMSLQKKRRYHPTESPMRLCVIARAEQIPSAAPGRLRQNGLVGYGSLPKSGSWKLIMPKMVMDRTLKWELSVELTWNPT